MTTAQELIDDPGLGIDEVTASIASIPDGYTQDELALFNIGVDEVEDLFIKIYNFGRKGVDSQGKKDVILAGEGLANRSYIDNIRSIVTDVVMEDSIDQTPTFTMTLHDPDWELLNTGALNHTIDINPGKLPGRWYRLNTVAVEDDEVTLTFITRNAAYLSFHTRPYKVSRNKMTRALFILTLLHHVKKKGVNIKLYCPELRKKQPIAKTKPASKKSVKSRRGQGFDTGVKLKFNDNSGAVIQMTSHDLKIADEILNAGEQMKATPRAMVCAIAVASIETGFGRTKNSYYIGYFQQTPNSSWPATGDAYKDAKGFFKVLIPLVNSQPHAGIGDLCVQTQRPGDQLYAMKCDRARDNADKIVKAWTGGLGADAADESFIKAYEFMIGPPKGPRGENYLAAIYRMAEEVRWSAYWVRDVLHFISQDDLFKSQARALIRYHDAPPEDPKKHYSGISCVAESVSASWDRGRPVQQMTLQVRMVNWVAPIGTVVVFDEGGPLQGRWLVTNVRKSVFDTLGEVTVAQPIHERKEPVHEIGHRPKDGGDTSPTTAGDIEGWPKNIIDTVVIPIANSIADTFRAANHQQLNSNNVKLSNDAHGGVLGGGRSDHQGPPWYAWAADCFDSVDYNNPTPAKDKLANALKDRFDLPHAWGGNSCYTSHKGRYRFNICYRMSDGQAGNHFNHVHIGVQDTSASISAPARKRPLGARHS